MKPAEIRAAKARLDTTWARMARALGIAEVTAKKYASGERRIPERIADGVAALLARRERELALRAEADRLAL